MDVPDKLNSEMKMLQTQLMDTNKLNALERMLVGTISLITTQATAPSPTAKPQM